MVLIMAYLWEPRPALRDAGSTQTYVTQVLLSRVSEAALDV